MKKTSMLIGISLLISLLPACSMAPEKTVVRSELELIEYDKNQLVNHADVIVEGIVVSQEIEKDFEGFPVTDTMLKVTKVFKGDPGETVEIRVNGGETDDMIYIPEEDILPNFKIDEKVIVFLTSNKGKRPDKEDFGYYVVGQHQGKFNEAQNSILANKAHSFDLDNFQEEINIIDTENKKNGLKRFYLKEGEESKI